MRYNGKYLLINSYTFNMHMYVHTYHSLSVCRPLLVELTLYFVGLLYLSFLAKMPVSTYQDI